MKNLFNFKWLLRFHSYFRTGRYSRHIFHRCENSNNSNTLFLLWPLSLVFCSRKNADVLAVKVGHFFFIILLYFSFYSFFDFVRKREIMTTRYEGGEGMKGKRIYRIRVSLRIFHSLWYAKRCGEAAKGDGWEKI